jgi:N-formylglutamate deformylase
VIDDRAGGPNVEVLPPTAGDAPVLVHVPHASTVVPGEVRAELLLSDEELAGELARLTDHRTDVLAAGTAALGATRVVNRRSRLVVDPERFPDDREAMAAVGMAAVYTHGSLRQQIRTPDPARDARLLARYLDPYAAVVERTVAGLLDRHGRCTIVDLHSYPSVRLPYELHDGPRPALCVGTDRVHTPRWLWELVVEVAARHGLECRFDTPFEGTYVPLGRHGHDQRVSSVMLEVRRDTYLDEATASPHAGESLVTAVLTEIVAQMSATADLRA